MIIPEGGSWNEVEFPRGDPLNQGLLSLLIITKHLEPVLIGTAFIIKAASDRVVAVSAAHCFEEIRTILQPKPMHHVSALPEFLPPRKQLDLKQVKCLYAYGANRAMCTIDHAWWDTDTDLALFTMIPPDDRSIRFKEFLLDNTVPEVGDPVTMVGFGEMAVSPDSKGLRQGVMQRRLTVRIGHVEEVYHKRHMLLHGPCVQTSIAVFPGMSGGMVLRGWPEPLAVPRPFAIVSHSISEDDPNSVNVRSRSGQSFGAILPMNIRVLDDGQRNVSFSLNNMGYGRTTA